MSGKGSSPRPYSVDGQTFASNWDRIFGKPKAPITVTVPADLPVETDMSLESLIDQCIAAKAGDKEFALFAVDGEWEAMIGNTCRAVYIGEANPEFSAKGATACDAVRNLIQALKESP